MFLILSYRISLLKPQVKTPKDTICYYNITMSSYSYRKFYFTLNQYESLSASSLDGKSSISIYKYGRMLVDRNLETTSKYYINFESNGALLLYTNKEEGVSSFNVDKLNWTECRGSFDILFFLMIFLPCVIIYWAILSLCYFCVNLILYSRAKERYNRGRWVLLLWSIWIIIKYKLDERKIRNAEYILERNKRRLHIANLIQI